MSSEALSQYPGSEPSAKGAKLPSSVEAEQAVLGGLMLDNSRLDAVLEIASEVDFYREDHKLILRMKKHTSRNKNAYERFNYMKFGQTDDLQIQ